MNGIDLLNSLLYMEYFKNGFSFSTTTLVNDRNEQLAVSNKKNGLFAISSFDS